MIRHPDLRTNHTSAGTASWQPHKTCVRPYDSVRSPLTFPGLFLDCVSKTLASSNSCSSSSPVHGWPDWCQVRVCWLKHLPRRICVQVHLQSMDSLTGARYECTGCRKGVPCAIAVWATSVSWETSSVAYETSNNLCFWKVQQQQCRG